MLAVAASGTSQMSQTPRRLRGVFDRERTTKATFEAIHGGDHCRAVCSYHKTGATAAASPRGESSKHSWE